MTLDTASLKSVRQFEENYAQTGFGPVYALLCNAGISGTHTGLTEDDFDVVFQTNHLGHFLLTMRMLPHMAESILVLPLTCSIMRRMRRSCGRQAKTMFLWFKMKHMPREDETVDRTEA